MPSEDWVSIEAMRLQQLASSLILLLPICAGSGCSKNLSQQTTLAASTNQTALGYSRNEEEWRALGVVTRPGMKPFEWPKSLIPVRLGETVRYRNTEYVVSVQLEDVLGDKEAFVVINRGEERVSRLYLPDGGQFAILDTDTQLPALEGWGERIDGLIARWLIVPGQNGSKLSYEISYVEFYTPNQNQALSQEAHKVQLRPGTKTLTGFFVGHLTTTTQEDASHSLQEAHNLH
jgi:hypothetical protein